MRRVAWAVVVAGCHASAPGPDGTIVASNVAPAQMVTDGSYLYWSDYRLGIVKTPLDARDAAPITVVEPSTAQQPQALAIDATSLYWANAGDSFANNGSIMKVALTGGTPVTLLANTFGPPPNWMTVGTNAVYFTNEASVWSISLSNGLLERIAPNETEAQEICVTGSHLYWTDIALGAIRSLDLSNPSATPTNFAPAMIPFHIATDGVNVYWNQFPDGFNDQVMKAPIAGGDPVMLHQARTDNGFVSGGVATDGINIYWSTDNAVMRIGIDGTGYKVLAANNQDLRAMTLGPTSVYWESVETIQMSGGDLTTSGIRETAK